MTHLLFHLVHGPWAYLSVATVLGGVSSNLGGWVARRRTWHVTQRRLTWAALVFWGWWIFAGWSEVATVEWRPMVAFFMEGAAVIGIVCSLLMGIVKHHVYRSVTRRRLAWAVLVGATLLAVGLEGLVSV